MEHFISGQAVCSHIGVNRQKLVLASSCLSVCPHTSNAAPSGLICVKFDIEDIYENLSRNFKCHLNRISVSDTLRVDLVTFTFTLTFTL